MSGRKSLLAILAGFLALSTPLFSQSLPQGVLDAERESRWSDAEALYRQALVAEPDRWDLWKRLADVLVADGRLSTAAEAFEEAARLAATNAELFAQASSARAMLGEAHESLRLIDEALKIEPDEPSYVRRRADLLVWTGDYGAAADFAERALELDPSDLEARLLLARIEAWCGDYPEALSILEEYRAAGGEASTYDAERTLALAWAERPDAALAAVEPALASEPDYPPLLVGRAVALARANRYDDLLRDLDKLRDLRPEDTEVSELRRVLVSPLQSNVDFDVFASRDRDEIERIGGALSLDYKLAEGDYASFGAGSAYSRAPSGSPLAPESGDPEAVLSSGWGALDLTLSPTWSLRAGGGGARTSFDETIGTYDARLEARLTDAVRFEVGAAREFFAASPRALSLGIVDSRAHAGLFLAPGLEWKIDLSGEFATLSDDNDRRSLAAAVRHPLMRKTKVNLDLGWSGYFLSYGDDFDHGYYDPSRYQRHLLTASFYFKLTDDDGLSLFLAPGIQKDAKMEGVELAGDLAAELTIGIYRQWLLKGRFAASLGASDYTRNYWIVSGGFFVMKRF